MYRASPLCVQIGAEQIFSAYLFAGLRVGFASVPFLTLRLFIFSRDSISEWSLMNIVIPPLMWMAASPALSELGMVHLRPHVPVHTRKIVYALLL